MLRTLAGLCAIFALLILFRISKDIVCTLWYKFRKQEYQWKTPQVFQKDEEQDMGVSLILGIAWFVGLYVLYSELLRLHP